MAKVMGAHGAGSALWLACADDTGLLDVGDDYRLTVPSALESGEALERAQEDLARIVRRHAPDEVWILKAVSNYEGTYESFVPRVTLETLLVLASAGEGVPVQRVARPTVGKSLGLQGQKGGLEKHSNVLDVKQSPHWGPRKRDLAAMTAVAGVKELADD